MNESKYRQLQQLSDRFAVLYGSRDSIVEKQTARYAHLLETFADRFGERKQVLLVSAPGRTEISGNHTDHNRGKVLTASVNLDALAAVSPRDDMTVHIHSEGYPPLTMDLKELALVEAEKNTTASLVRGIAHWLSEHGYALGGFDAAVQSTVFSGSGLSSSAAFEIMLCGIFSALYNNWAIDAVTRAKCAQYAENVYFGKPSGLLDQMSSSMGGLVAIDFQDEEPKIDAIAYDFAKKGFALVVVNTGGSHGDLTHCYSAIPNEMHAVAQYFGKANLRDVPQDTFFQSIPALRKALTLEYRDRAILRAQHFYEENKRVDNIVQALRQDDMQSFLQGIIASGQSSMIYLQNIYATPDRQEITLALMMAEQLLRGKGAWRVHGGGFAGTTLNFVPLPLLTEFKQEMEAVFGSGSAAVLDIRPEGPAVIRLD